MVVIILKTVLYEVSQVTVLVPPSLRYNFSARFLVIAKQLMFHLLLGVVKRCLFLQEELPCYGVLVFI